MIQIEIPMKLPSLNDYINVCRTNRYQAASFKRELEETIAYYLKPLPVFEKPISIYFVWVENDRRRDYDNICFAKKFILDALVKLGKVKDDNRKFIVGFHDSFTVEKKPRVVLFIQEEEQ